MQPAGPPAADRTDRPTDSAPSHAMANRRLRPPLATMGQGRGVYRRRRALQSVHPQRAASRQVVRTCVFRTNSHRGGHHGTLYDGRTADSRRVHAAYGLPTPPRAWLVCGTRPVAAPWAPPPPPALVAHRPPPLPLSAHMPCQSAPLPPSPPTHPSAAPRMQLVRLRARPRVLDYCLPLAPAASAHARDTRAALTTTATTTTTFSTTTHTTTTPPLPWAASVS